MTSECHNNTADNDNEIYTILSSDQVEFKVNKKVISKVGLLRKIFLEFGFNPADTVPLTKCDSTVLGYILEYLKRHEDDEPHPTTAKERRAIPLTEWDSEYLKISTEQLIKVMEVLNFLDCTSMLDACSKKIKSYLQGMSTKEMNEMFEIECDLTASELADLERHTKWCMN